MLQSAACCCSVLHCATFCSMSKSVRLPDYLAVELERLAAEEKRSLASMVRLLLEQALAMDTLPVTKTVDVGIATAQVSTTPRIERLRSTNDDHFKPDFKGKR